jgi:hypothetical protein
MRSLRKKILTKASSKDSKGGEELLSKENSTYKAWFFSLKTRIVSAHTSLLIL